LKDGFGDGDRNNTAPTDVAPTDATDVGTAWYLGAGTSAVTLTVVNDATSITGNTLQLFNTASNNRPVSGQFADQALADGDKIVLRFDARVVSATPATSDRSFRFGLYNNAGTYTAGDKGSTDLTYNDDVGYNARVDVGADASNSTSMDLTRDDSGDTATIIGGTATGLSATSTNAANQLANDTVRHFVLTLTRSGTGLAYSLQQDGNAAITGTDATPTGFTFNEVSFSARSSAAMDLRMDNIEVEYTAAVPEPAAAAIFALATTALGLRRRSSH
jgi:hypothetical protein